MARYKAMTEEQMAARDSDLLELQEILTSTEFSKLSMKLCQKTGSAYNTILNIKSGTANPSHAITRKLLKAAKSLDIRNER